MANPSTSVTPTQVGVAQLFALSGTKTITGFANLVFQPQSAKFAHKNTLKDAKDSLGYDIAAYSVNEYIEATLEFEITADTITHAKALAAVISPLSAITLGGFDAAIANGLWQYRGELTIDLATETVGKISLPIRRYLDSTQNTNLTTAQTA